jgi:hypothetical protein
MSSSRSRPSSAKPTVERPVTVEKRLAVERPVAAARRGSVVETEHFITDCKAAYLSVFGDLKVDIESKPELCKGKVDIESKPELCKGKVDIESKPELCKGKVLEKLVHKFVATNEFF